MFVTKFLPVDFEGTLYNSVYYVVFCQKTGIFYQNFEEFDLTHKSNDKWL